MHNKLAAQYNFFSLLRFSLPTIIMMIFMSLYSMVDGIFVSRLLGTNALSAVNIVFPLINVVIAMGIMLATGGSAVVARKMGEGDEAGARRNFSLLAFVAVGIGLLLTALGFVFMQPLLRFLGATPEVYALCSDYAYWMLAFTTPAMLQMLFQSFFVTAGRPGIGLFVTAAGGIANIVLDYVFIAIFDWGIAGAAVATGIGFCIPAVFGLLWFSLNRRGTLYFTKTRWQGRMLLEACGNGSSEMVSNLSSAVVTYLFNRLMLHYLGVDGVAAITVVLYAEYLLVALYLGFSSGIAPILSYNHGEGNTAQLKRLFRVSMVFIIVTSALTFAGALVFAGGIVTVFAPADTDVYALAVHGLRLYAFCFLFKGVNIFASSLFTALSDGKTSALLSFMRTLVFIVAGIALLPLVWGVNGVWLAVPFAETLSLALSLWGFRWQHRERWNKAPQ